MKKGNLRQRLLRLPACIILIVAMGAGLCSAGAASPSLQAAFSGNRAPLSGSAAQVRTPVASGTKIAGNAQAVIDYSNASQGYVMVKYTGDTRKIKVLIQKSGGTQYRYDLNQHNAYEVFSLTDGDGSYTIGVYENMFGQSYGEALSATIQVALESPILPYLYPNQYVNFTQSSKSTLKSDELARNAVKDIDIISNVYHYVTANMTYDTQKAERVSAGQLVGYLPNLDEIMSAPSLTGICFDYASLMSAMLRAQGIPTRLEVGLVSGGAKHAWISVYTTEAGWINNLIRFDGKQWKMMDPTFAASGEGSELIMQYIGNGNNYTVQNHY